MHDIQRKAIAVLGNLVGQISAGLGLGDGVVVTDLLINGKQVVTGLGQGALVASAVLNLIGPVGGAFLGEAGFVRAAALVLIGNVIYAVLIDHSVLLDAILNGLDEVIVTLLGQLGDAVIRELKEGGFVSILLESAKAGTLRVIIDTVRMLSCLTDFNIFAPVG